MPTMDDALSNVDNSSAITPPSTPDLFDAIQLSVPITLNLDTEVAKRLNEGFQGKKLDIAAKPWTLICFSPENAVMRPFCLREYLRQHDFSHWDLLYVVECGDPGNYEAVVESSHLSMFARKVGSFTIRPDYDPLKPTEKQVLALGDKAKIKAQSEFLCRAVQASFTTSTSAASECYFDLVGRAGLMHEYDRLMLKRDIEHSQPPVLDEFAYRLLSFCYYHCNLNNHHEVENLVQRKRNDWIKVSQEGSEEWHTSLKLTYITAGDATLSHLITRLIRGLFEVSGGRIDDRQYDLPITYSVDQNAALCAQFLGIRNPCQNGRCSPSVLYTLAKRLQVSTMWSGPSLYTLVNKSRCAMEVLPLVFKSSHLGLPSQVLRGFGTQQIVRVCEFLKETYTHLPVLYKIKSSPFKGGQSLAVLKAWKESEESLSIYKQLIKSLRSQQTPAQISMILAALWVREILLDVSSDTDLHQSDNPLMVFAYRLHSRNPAKEPNIFGPMALALLQALKNRNDVPSLIDWLKGIEVVAKRAPNVFDSLAERYWSYRLNGCDHARSMEQTISELLHGLKSVKYCDEEADDEADDEAADDTDDEWEHVNQ